MVMVAGQRRRQSLVLPSLQPTKKRWRCEEDKKSARDIIAGINARPWQRCCVNPSREEAWKQTNQHLDASAPRKKGTPWWTQALWLVILREKRRR